MKTVENLQAGETLLVSAKAVNGGKIQLEFAEPVKSPYAKGSNSIVSRLNKSDARFSQSSARRALVSGEKSDILAMFGEQIKAKLEESGQDMSVFDNLVLGQAINIGVLNPTLEGERVHLQGQISHRTSPLRGR